MTSKQWKEYHLPEMVQRDITMLNDKRAEYADDDDIFSNFEKAASFNTSTQEKQLWNYCTKHIISVQEMVAGLHLTKYPLSQWEEKLGDIRRYLYLLEGMMREKEATRLEVKYEYKEDDAKEMNVLECARANQRATGIEIALQNQEVA